MPDQEPRAKQFSEDMIDSQRVLSMDRLSTCTTSDCENDPSHVALVHVILLNGKQFSVVRHFCDQCAVAMNPKASA